MSNSRSGRSMSMERRIDIIETAARRAWAQTFPNTPYPEEYADAFVGMRNDARRNPNDAWLKRALENQISNTKLIRAAGSPNSPLRQPNKYLFSCPACHSDINTRHGNGMRTCARCGFEYEVKGH